MKTTTRHLNNSQTAKQEQINLEQQENPKTANQPNKSKPTLQQPVSLTKASLPNNICLIISSQTNNSNSKNIQRYREIEK
jgi:hypothetical protein